MTSTRLTLNSKFAAETRDNAKCAVETAVTDTLKSEKLRESMTGESGKFMTKTLADQTSMETLTLIDQLM